MTRAAGPVVTGVGVSAAIGQGAAAFAEGLFAGAHRFAELRRPGRQHGTGTRFVGAELASDPPATRPVPGGLRTASLTARVALATVGQAWTDAGLDDVDPARIGLIVGGSNTSQREQLLAHERHRDSPRHLRPSYGLSFWDTDVCGVCTAAFGIRGLAHTVGGASASGQLAVIEAAEAVAAGRVDVCLAVGALQDLSAWECQALQSMGAMVAPSAAGAPELACRPFDRDAGGFVFGEACAALVVERGGARAVPGYGRLSGWAVHLDGHRTPDPSVDGEVAAIRAALADAGLAPERIDYVNPHGTGSPLGDRTEVAALRACGLTGAALNATKSLTGHALSAAGAVEVAAVLLQMRHRTLHPTRNLDHPVDPDLDWVRDRARPADLRHCLSLSFGFGGLNTALCVSDPDADPK